MDRFIHYRAVPPSWSLILNQSKKCVSAAIIEIETRAEDLHYCGLDRLCVLENETVGKVNTHLLLFFQRSGRRAERVPLRTPPELQSGSVSRRLERPDLLALAMSDADVRLCKCAVCIAAPEARRIR